MRSAIVEVSIGEYLRQSATSADNNKFVLAIAWQA
jgi:hypothetical protein